MGGIYYINIGSNYLTFEIHFRLITLEAIIGLIKEYPL